MLALAGIALGCIALVLHRSSRYAAGGFPMGTDTLDLTMQTVPDLGWLSQSVLAWQTEAWTWTGAPSPLTNSTTKVVRLLNYARLNLLTQTVPMQLKATTYVKLCCEAIRKFHQSFAQLGLVYDPASTHPQSCAAVLAQLSRCHPQWWQTCWVSDRAILHSHDPAIHQLLIRLSDLIDLLTG